MHALLAQQLFQCDAKIGHLRFLLCGVVALQRMEPEGDLFCQDHPVFTPLPETLAHLRTLSQKFGGDFRWVDHFFSGYLRGSPAILVIQ